MYQMTIYTVDGHRIIAQKQHFHLHRISGSWSVSIHRHDPVHHAKPRFDQLIQIDQLSCKNVCIRIFGMPFGFMESADAAIQIFYPTGYSFESMCLHLTKIDQRIRFLHRFRQKEFFCRVPLRIRYRTSLIKINDRDTIIFQHLIHASTFHDFLR